MIRHQSTILKMWIFEDVMQPTAILKMWIFEDVIEPTTDLKMWIFQDVMLSTILKMWIFEVVMSGDDGDDTDAGLNTLLERRPDPGLTWVKGCRNKHMDLQFGPIEAQNQDSLPSAR